MLRKTIYFWLVLNISGSVMGQFKVQFAPASPDFIKYYDNKEKSKISLPLLKEISFDISPQIWEERNSSSTKKHQ